MWYLAPGNQRFDLRGIIVDTMRDRDKKAVNGLDCGNTVAVNNKSVYSISLHRIAYIL